MSESVKVHDSVCGTVVDTEEAHRQGLTVAYQGHTYFFCSVPCKLRFEADPGRFAQHQTVAR